jgi:hypothetical protein
VRRRGGWGEADHQGRQQEGRAGASQPTIRGCEAESSSWQRESSSSRQHRESLCAPRDGVNGPGYPGTTPASFGSRSRSAGRARNSKPRNFPRYWT